MRALGGGGGQIERIIFPGPVLLLFYEYLQFMHIVRNDLNKMALAIITSPLSVAAISSEW